jgi:MFS family permease
MEWPVCWPTKWKGIDADGRAGILLAVPYGLLADRIGRKPTILLSIPGFILNVLITGVTLYFSNIFPLRAVWLSALAWLFGGGLVVAAAVIWTMMADVTTEAQRWVARCLLFSSY